MLQTNNFGKVIGAGLKNITRIGFKFGMGNEIKPKGNNSNPTVEVIRKPIAIGF